MRLDGSTMEDIDFSETPAEARERMVARLHGDDQEFENKHKRDKNGRFAKMSEGASPEGAEQGPTKESGRSSKGGRGSGKENGGQSPDKATGASKSKASNGSKSETKSTAKSGTSESEPVRLIDTPEGKRLDEGLRNGSVSCEEALNNPIIKKEQDRIRKQKDEPDSWKLTKDDPERQAWRKQVAKEYSEKYGSYSGNGNYNGPVTKGFRAEIVIGPPAGGKSSTIVNGDSAATGSRVLDSDEIKKSIPEFDDGRNAGYVQEESSHILNDMVMNDYYSGGAHCGDNIIIPIVGQKPNRSLEYLQKLTDAGYEVHLSFNDVSAENSLRRSLTRAIETGRHIGADYIMGIGGKCQKVYELLKKHGGFASYTKVDNNGAKPQRMEHLDKNGNPIED